MLCFRKFPEAKKLMDEGEGEVSRFSFEKFLSHCANKFVGEPFIVSLISSIGNDWMRGWGKSRFSFENFLSHSEKIFVGEPFGVSIISGTENC